MRLRQILHSPRNWPALVVLSGVPPEDFAPVRSPGRGGIFVAPMFNKNPSPVGGDILRRMPLRRSSGNPLGFASTMMAHLRRYPRANRISTTQLTAHVNHNPACRPPTPSNPHLADTHKFCVEFRIRAAQREQFIVCAALQDAALGEDEDQVGMTHGAESMGHHEARSALE